MLMANRNDIKVNAVYIPQHVHLLFLIYICIAKYTRTKQLASLVKTATVIEQPDLNKPIT
jgi:hypothetical protein